MSDPGPGDNEFPEYYTDMPVGEILRRARQYYGQSLEDVEASLRIRSSQLQAIEEGDLDRLPGRVYAIGFVRSYSEYLGLDGDKMAHLLKIQSGGGPRPPELHLPVPASESHVPSYTIIAAVVLVLIGAGLSFALVHMDDDSQPVLARHEIPEVPEELKITDTGPDEISESVVDDPASSPDMPQEMRDTQAAPDDEESSRDMQPLTIRARGSVWVDIRNVEGESVYTGVLEKGESLTPPPGGKHRLTTENIGRVEILLGDDIIVPASGANKVARDVKLERQALEARFLQ